MDVNELNKLSVTALFSKLTAQPNAGSTSGNSFASMLGQVDVAGDLKPTVSENMKPVKNDTPVYKPENDKPVQENSDKKDAGKVDVSNAKNNKKDAKLDKSKPSVDKTPVDDSTQSLQTEENSKSVGDDASLATMNVIPLAEPLAPTAEASGVDTSELVNIADSTMADGAELGGASTAGGEEVTLPTGSLQISDEDGLVLKDFQIKPEHLIGMKVASFYDVKTGETTKMSGVELSAKLFGVEQTNKAIAMITPEAASAVDSVIPADALASDLVAAPVIVAAADKFAQAVKDAVAAPVAEDVVSAPVEEEGNLSAVAAPIVSQKNKSQTTTALVDDGLVDEPLVSDGINEQSEKLAQIMDGKQIKVDVKVEEEKISYRSGQDLIKDRSALDKAVSATADSEISSVVSPAATSKVTAAQSMISPVNTPPIAAVAVQNIVADDGVAPLVVASEASSVTTAANTNVHLSGSEFANATKADANAKAPETSFKDIYKGMSKEAVEQVKVNITKSAVKGIDTIDVRLKPEDLGHIEVKMQIKDGKLHAHIISSRPETMEALQKDAQVLEKAFNDAGFQTDENSLSFSFRGDDQANQYQERNPELRNFIGEVFEAEANGETLDADAANQNWSAEKGLNIKV